MGITTQANQTFIIDGVGFNDPEKKVSARVEMPDANRPGELVITWTKQDGTEESIPSIVFDTNRRKNYIAIFQCILEPGNSFHRRDIILLSQRRRLRSVDLRRVNHIFWSIFFLFHNPIFIAG